MEVYKGNRKFPRTFIIVKLKRIQYFTYNQNEYEVIKKICIEICKIFLMFFIYKSIYLINFKKVYKLLGILIALFGESFIIYD